MSCMRCKYGDLREGTTTHFVELNHRYIIIENVPCLKCDQCGEVFFRDSVAEKLESIVESLEQIASKIFILDYTTAA